MSHEAFPYPLPACALAAFCHPREGHLLASPLRHDGEILAASGYVALRAHRGGWLDREFPEAGGEFLERLGKLPWGRWQHLVDDWRPLDSMRGKIYFHGRIEPWARWQMAPSPVWRVNEIPVRLSLLQLVARLPRAEVYCGESERDAPVWFRFTGGRGAIARDARLTASSFALFAPARDLFDGGRVNRPKGARPSFTQPGVNWPPVDRTDEESGRDCFLD